VEVAREAPGWVFDLRRKTLPYPSHCRGRGKNRKTLPYPSHCRGKGKNRKTLPYHSLAWEGKSGSQNGKV
jgi:hypothetical protein